MKIKIYFAAAIAILSISLVGLMGRASYAQGECAGVPTAVINCDPSKAKEDAKTVEESGLWALLEITINIMAVGVGVAAVGGFIYAGMLYAAAGDNQEQVKKAIDTIRNVVIGLILFAVMFTAVNYLVPGDILR